MARQLRPYIRFLLRTGAIMIRLASTSRLAVLAVLMAQPAMAAPFCIQSQVLPPQCIYYDARECNQEAQRQGAACNVNPADVTLRDGPGQFCVVTSGHFSNCAYLDRPSCEQEATRQRGTCATSTAHVAVGSPDPYSVVNGQ
jgi:hypothetical protein